MSDIRRANDVGDHIWKWICRILIVALILYWAFNGLEPSERWIGLIVVLLGFNEFRVRKNKDGTGYSINVGTSKNVDERTDSKGPDDSAVSLDRTSLVAFRAI